MRIAGTRMMIAPGAGRPALRRPETVMAGGVSTLSVQSVNQRTSEAPLYTNG
jgi:hypothetical protein